jgi:hypothetical protein
MVLLVLLAFCTLVAGIGIITSRLNEKAPCDHEWVETHNGHKCTKCFRVISRAEVEQPMVNEDVYMLEEA